MKKTQPQVYVSNLCLALVFLISSLLGGCKTGSGGAALADSFGFDQPMINLPVVHPPKSQTLKGYEYLRIHDFEGSSECAESLQRKILDLAGELGDRGFKLGPFFPKDKTVELRGEISKCELENSYGRLEAEFSFTIRGVQRETKTISKNVTLGPSSTRERVIKKLVSYVGREFSKTYLPRNVESLRWLCGGDRDPGIIAAQKGSWDAAISHWTGALTQDQNNSCIQNNIGVVSEGKGDLPTAAKFYQLAMAQGDEYGPQNYAELRRYCLDDMCGAASLPCPTYPDCVQVCPIQEQDSRPRPLWVNKPSAQGYAFVVRGSGSEGGILADLEHAAEADARIKLSAAMSVNVEGVFEEYREHLTKESLGDSASGENTTSSETSTLIKEFSKERTKNILVGVEPLEYWRDGQECTVYALMGITQESLEKSLAAYKTQLEQSLLSKPIMLFDLSETPSDMADNLQVKLATTLKDLGVSVRPQDQDLKICLEGATQSKCQGTMFGGFSAQLVEEAKAQGHRKREFSIKGKIVFGDSLVLEVHDSCLGQGAEEDSNRVIDQNGIEECFGSVIASPLLRDLQR